MAKNILESVALQQQDIEVDGEHYMLEAWPATFSLTFMAKNAEALESGKHDLTLIKQVITKSVYKNGELISDKSFDIIFSRKIGHLTNLYHKVLEYNLGDLFTQPDSEE